MSSSPYNPLGPAHHESQDWDAEAHGHWNKRVAVFYATREGHTRRIAERILASLRTQGFDVDIHNVLGPFAFDLSHYSAVVLAASVHSGSHEKEMIQFVKDHHTELSRMPTAFISVTLSRAGAERTDASPAEHAQFVADVEEMSQKFFKQTDWYPTYAKPVAGAILYTHYNFLLRFIMKRIARKAGSGTDTNRDYDYTDWVDLDNFVNEFAEDIRLSTVPEDRRAAEEQADAERSLCGV